MPVGDEPRADVQVTTGSDGSFWAHLTSFPTSEPPHTPPHHLMAYIDALGYVRARRDFYVHPGMAVDLGVIDVALRDSNTVTIDASGGSVTDSQGLITVQFPPGALSAPTPITVTPIAHRQEMPAALPPISATGYGFEIEPSGTVLNAAATVQVTNWRNIPTTVSMPVGFFDDTNGGWKHVAMATWSGTAWTAQIQHFSNWDFNPNEYGEWVLFGSKGRDPNGTKANACVGSSVSLNGGDMSFDIALPSYPHRGRDFGVTLNYNSALAASRSLGTPPQTTAGAIPVTGVAVAIRGDSFQRQCIASQTRAAVLIAATPGACGGGSCSLATATGGVWSFETSLLGMQSTLAASPTGNANAIDYGGWVDLPLMPDGTVPSSGFLNQQVQAGPEFSGTSGTSSACLTSGAFASPDLGAAVQSVAIESGPLFTIQREVFMHHRHSSPFGPGWAISNLSRIFQEPQADHAVLIGGDGSEEDFRIRPEVTSPYANVGYASYAFALDPTTGAQLMATGSGNVVELNANGSQTAVASGVGFTGVPQSMAVTYVGGEQRILIATTTELVQVHPGGAIDVLYTRSGNGAQLYVPSQVAARNDLAIYTEGKDSNPVLYRIRLSTPPGAPEVISFPQATGGDIGLDPAQNVLSQYRFYGPGGEAYTSSGALFVADAPRSAVYLVQPDVNGEIGPTSAIARALGDGAGRYVPDLGTPFSALDFPINQPFLLSVSPDGTLLMGTQYGVAAYDPQATQAEWIAFGQSAPNSTLPVDLTGTSGQYTNIAATGPRSFLIAFSQSGTWPSVVNASQLASEYDPTRTLTLSPAGATLVDTTQGVVDSFDGQGRLAQRNLRTSEPVFAVTYVDPVSDRVQTISDPEGGVTTFAYDSSNRLSTITDPANRQTTFAHDGFGDLRSITQPDGEVTSYTYQAHQVVTKTTRGTDVTSYVYNSDGTLQSATKPAGETTTVTATSLSQSPQYDSNGNPTYSGSYTDAHGVTHTFVTDALGQLQSDTYTADGIQYNYGVTYYNGAGGQLEPVSGEVYGHRNTILRIGSERLNGVPTGPSRSFDSLGRLVAISDSPGLHSGQTIASYSFNANGFLSDIALQGVSFIDKQITRDAAGHILQVLDHGNEGYSNRHEVDYTWRSDGQPATVTRDGLLYTLTYDDAATHQLTGISDALGRTTSFSLDSVGRVGMTTVGNPGANAGDGSTTTSFAYDDNDRLRVVADALGNQTLFGYTQVSCGCTEADEVTSIETPDLLPPKQWQLVYGPEGRLSTIADPAGFPEAYGYEPTGELNSIVDRDGNTTALTHDHLGRVATVVDALNRTHGRLYSIPTNGSWSGPTLTSGSASSTPASTNYASTLNAGDYQIGNGLYPVYGQPPSESFYRDATFELPYVAGWDLGNRLTTYVERPAQPSSAVETLDGTGNPASISYDQYTSQVTGFSKTGRGFSGFGYNNDYDLTGSNGYGAGNCIGDPQTNYTYQRDLGNRVTQVQTSYGLGCFAPLTVQSQRYTYFADGALQSYSGPDGNRTYAYDARGLVHILTDSADKNESWSFTYDTAGRSFDVTYPDGHVREQLYDDEGRLKSRCYKYGSQSFCYTATYDGAGNPLTTSDPYGGSETYQYDAVNRLTSVTRSVGGSVEHVETYSYNALGALHTGFDVTAMAEVTYDDKRATLSGSGTADSAIPNSLEGQPVTRDSLGEVTAFAGSTLTFNTAHRVVSAQANDGSVSETYRYDPSLRRNYLAHTETNAANNVQELYMYDRPGSNLLSAVDPSGTTAYSEDPGNIIATLNTSGVIQNSYLFAGVDQPLRVTQWSWVCPTFNEACTTGTSQPVCVNHTSVNCVSTPSPVYYEVDVTGNVRRFRNAGSGDLGGYRYTAFGQTFPPDATTPATTVTQLLRWKGRPFVNVAGGLYDMRARFWNPQMGAFLNIDAYAYHDASSTLWGWGNQNPIRYGDPSGRVIVALDQAALVALNNLENNPNLLAQLQELENDPNLVIEIMHDASDLANFPGGSVACSDGSGLCAIGYDMATAPLGDDLEEVLAHELGHVYGLYFGEDIKEEDYSVEFENLQRGGPVCR
jgi:RHS repeat-associated protein